MVGLIQVSRGSHIPVLGACEQVSLKLMVSGTSNMNNVEGSKNVSKINEFVYFLFG